MNDKAAWPDLLSAWSDTCDTLHLWSQVVGKVRLKLTPLVNHWWNVTLYLTPRGLTTSQIAYGARTFEIAFDFLDHRLCIETDDGKMEALPLRPMSVRDFYLELMSRLRRLGIEVRIWTMPVEIENAAPFEQDQTHAHYDATYARRFWLALLQADRVMKAFRARFIGKASPYSHECSSCGFWPGNGGYGRAAFYVYAYPEPPGYGEARLQTAEAFYDRDLGQFILPYDAVRASHDPDALLLGFLQETYAAAADLAHWDRQALERVA